MSVKIESRKQWGARFQDGDLNLTSLAVGVFVHHSVTAQLSENATPDEERAQMRAIESIGQSRFRTGISYNVIVFPSGRAYQGVSFNRRGTHTGGLNSSVRSICFAGNYEVNKPTAAQLATAAAIFAEGKGKWWKSDAYLKGHRDQKSTACPGKNVYSRLNEIRSGASQPAAPKPTTSKPSTKPNKPNTKPSASKLDVDGKWGAETTKALQRHFKTPVDGVISHQWKDNANKNILSAQFDKTGKGSPLITAMQTFLKGKGLYKDKVDGLAGANFISALQRYYKTPVDGQVWLGSPMVKKMQEALNTNSF